MALKGPAVGATGALAATIKRLASVPSRASSTVAKALRRSLADQFNRGVDPYGKAWKPLAPSTIAKGRHPPPLDATGKMRRGLRVRPRQGGGVEIVFTTRAKIASYHQTGTRRMPARPVLPRGAFPKAWRAIVDRAARKAFAT